MLHEQVGLLVKFEQISSPQTRDLRAIDSIPSMTEANRSIREAVVYTALE